MSADPPGWLLRYLCPRRTARRSHCRYTIEICSRDVSGNPRSGFVFSRLSPRFSRNCENYSEADARAHDESEKSRGRGTSEVRLIALLSLAEDQGRTTDLARGAGFRDL